MGTSYAFYDEGAYRNELRHGDLRQAPEALRLINSGFRVDGKRQPEAEVQEVEIGRYYGDATQGNLRVAFNERTLHPFQPYDTTAMANQLEYFQKVFQLDKPALK